MDIRAATSDEADQVAALVCERNGDECDLGVRSLFERADVGVHRFAVAVDHRRRVRSTLCLVPERLRIGSTIVGAGQVEYVATARDHEGLGLVRRLMGLVHQWSAADGDVVQLIAGIPYFYRKFGYEYAIPFPRLRLVTPGHAPETPTGWTVRLATAVDIASLARLQHNAQLRADLAVVEGDAAWWSWWVATGQEPRWSVAVDPAGQVRGAAAIGGGPPGVGDHVAMVGAPAADEPDALLALLAEAASEPGRLGAVEERVGTTETAYGRTHLHPRRYAVYVRIDDPVEFLRAIAGALDERLARSPFHDATGRLVVSLYTRALAVEVEHGSVVAVAWTDDEDPDAVLVPPDRIATFLLGRHGATGMAEREDDVRIPTAVAGLADALFPHLSSDVTLL